MSKGILIPIGGAESKGSKVDIDNSILSEVIKVSKFGTDSNIIIIPTASSYQNEIDSEYRTTFERIGCKNIKTLFIDKIMIIITLYHHFFEPVNDRIGWIFLVLRLLILGPCFRSFHPDRRSNLHSRPHPTC